MGSAGPRITGRAAQSRVWHNALLLSAWKLDVSGSSYLPILVCFISFRCVCLFIKPKQLTADNNPGTRRSRTWDYGSILGLQRKSRAVSWLPPFSREGNLRCHWLVFSRSLFIYEYLFNLSCQAFCRLYYGITKDKFQEVHKHRTRSSRAQRTRRAWSSPVLHNLDRYSAITFQCFLCYGTVHTVFFN